MRVFWLILIGICLASWSFGCKNTGPEIKPPKGPEEYRLPPDNDPRYSKHVTYPKDTLYQSPIKKTQDPNGMPFSPSMQTRPGAFGVN